MSTGIQVNEEKCTGCRICIQACPEPNVIQYKDNKKVAVNELKCKLCLLCMSVCPKKALTREGV